MLVALSLLACSDYAVTENISDDGTTMTVGEYVEIIPDNNDGIDTVDDTTDDCGTYEDHDIYGTIVETSSFPEVTIVSPVDDIVYLTAGEPLVIETEFAAQDGCGSYMVRENVHNLNDFSPGAVWIYEHWEDMAASTLSEMSTGVTFPDAVAEGAGFGLDPETLEIVDGGTQWVWRTPESYWVTGVEIDSQIVEGASPLRYQFTWNGSEYAPIGEELVFSISFDWNDVESGSPMAPNSADREITVIIVE